MEIDIYRKQGGQHHPLSNFAPYMTQRAGLYWPTVEHAFQAAKFYWHGGENHVHIVAIRTAPTPAAVKKLGKSRKHPIDPAWDERRVGVMYELLRRKLKLNPEVLWALGATGTNEIVERSPWDYFWGTGRSGTGQNQLGKLWMRIRDEGV